MRDINICESRSFLLQSHCSLLYLSNFYSEKIRVMRQVLRFFFFFFFIWDSIQPSFHSLTFHVNTAKTPHCEAWLHHTVTISSEISLVGVELSAFCEQGSLSVKEKANDTVYLVKAIIVERNMLQCSHHGE